MSFKQTLIASGLIVLQCFGFSFQARASDSKSSECAEKLEIPLTSVRARIMPVGRTAPSSQPMDTLVHQTGDGRELLAAVGDSQLEVFHRQSELSESVFNQAISSPVRAKPIWFKFDDGDSSLIYVDGTILHVDFPGSRRAPIAISGLPAKAYSIQVMRSGPDEALILVVSESGQNEVLSLRQNELQMVMGFQGRPGSPAVLIPGATGRDFYALSVALRSAHTGLQIFDLNQVGGYKFLLPLLRGEKVLQMRALPAVDVDQALVEVQTGRRNFVVEISFSDSGTSHSNKDQRENPHEEK